MKPCINHNKTTYYPSKDVPEVTSRDLYVVQCKKCKYWYEPDRKDLYRRGLRGMALHNTLKRVKKRRCSNKLCNNLTDVEYCLECYESRDMVGSYENR